IRSRAHTLLDEGGGWDDRLLQRSQDHLILIRLRTHNTLHSQRHSHTHHNTHTHTHTHTLWHHEGTCGRGALCSSPGMATTPQDGCRENYISQNALLRQVQMPQPSDGSWSSGVGEGENKGAETHTKRGASYVAQTKFGV